MIEILFQYRYFQHILDVHKIKKKIYRKELWSTSDDLKRYALMSKEKLNLSNGKQMPPGTYKKINMRPLHVRLLDWIRDGCNQSIKKNVATSRVHCVRKTNRVALKTFDTETPRYQMGK